MVQFTVRPGLVIETALISRLQKLFSDVALQKHFRNQVVYLTVYLEPWDKLLSDHDLLARISKILKALLPVSIDFVSQEDLHEMCISIPIFYPTSVEGPHDRYLPVVNYLRQHAIAKVEGWVEDYPRNGLPFAREKVFRRRDAEYA
ncbi:hypothetical protein N7468_003827 [Penicillium chermesinum]|uniref:Uncharacterized protein n=1 Tax=Penicillium chermesinum TaxID=63820 RepID=A0A9W9P792_9EURO|nr:uncharacterized protein N7468_003827 [Penicillium chermesinum]KAJ5239208.1 hypothetical protein N7468_003827 [Penicillium chermesinum]